MERIAAYLPFLLALVLVSLGVPVHAEGPSADEILTKMDRQVNSFEDQEMDIKMTVFGTDGSSKSYAFNIKQKGDSKRLVRFLTGEVKGMSVLSVDHSRMYVYLPGYKRVRPIAAHNMNQSLAGSDFSNADMAAASWPKLYTPKMHKEDEEFWYLELTPKGEDLAYARVILKVGKKDFLQWGADYFNEKGELVKQFRGDLPRKYSGLEVEWHSLVEMTDPRTGHRTILEVLDIKFNQGLDDSVFTPRHLQWSR